MKPTSYHELLDDALRKCVPDDINLLPHLATQYAKGKSLMKTRMKVALGVTLALIVIALVLFTMPGVAQALRQLFGYLPGVGFVDRGASIWILKQPVSVTRDGITVTVTSATITANKTAIDYHTSGVPDSAYPTRPDLAGCYPDEYLRLPDGTKMIVEADMPPLPAGVNEVTFVLPCITNTLPGTVPENWELPLEFVPASPDIQVTPVIEILPSPSPWSEITPSAVPSNPMAITKVLDIGDSYILMGEFHSIVPAGASISGEDVLFSDANGKEMDSTESDVDEVMWPPLSPNATRWAYQINKNFAAPLTMTYTGRFAVPASPPVKVELAFDAGKNPQPGQEWQLNQDFKMDGHTLRLVSITADFHNGYVFSLESDDPVVRHVDVEITGYTPNGGMGGGGGPATKKWSEHTGLNFTELPKGKLNIVFSNLLLDGGSKTFHIQWSPDGTATLTPAMPAPLP